MSAPSIKGACREVPALSFDTTHLQTHTPTASGIWSRFSGVLFATAARQPALPQPEERPSHGSQRQTGPDPLASATARNDPAGVIRKLRAQDSNLYEDHLLRLDMESRSRRFMGGVSSEFVSRHAGRCIANGATVIAYIEREKVLAAAELHFDAEKKHAAEIAVSVEPALRRRGFGQRLLRRLIVAARNASVRQIRLNCHADNEPMLGLARKLKADITYARGEAFGIIELLLATPLSTATEVIYDIGEPIDYRRTPTTAQPM